MVDQSPLSAAPQYDVVVVGAGNAGLCSAISARQQGARVLVLEKAPPEEQGGNCRYTGGGLRFVHDDKWDLAPLLGTTSAEPDPALRSYPAEEYRKDLMVASRGEINPAILDLVLERSYDTMRWLSSLGIRWEQGRREAVAYTYGSGPVTLGAVRGGEGLLRMLTSAARGAGVDIAYGTKMLRLNLGPSNRVLSVTAADEDQMYEIGARSVILACGGFEANQEMRVSYLGPAWENASPRGSRYNTGDGLRAALALDAATTGRLTGCHATPVAVSAHSMDGPGRVSVLPLRSFHLGITVNVGGNRFMDEGRGIGDLYYCQAAEAILSQPRHVAFQLFDARTASLLASPYETTQPLVANRVDELAMMLDVPSSALERTLHDFNTCANVADFDPLVPDGNYTTGVTPVKSNWALPLDSPPFAAYPVTGAITYTYGGLKVDGEARVISTEGIPIRGLYAAGVIVGGFFYYESLRGSGLMLGAVLGRIAGQHAAAGQ